MKLRLLLTLGFMLQQAPALYAKDIDRSAYKEYQPKEGESVVTNWSRIDGFGSQFQTIIYAVLYADLNNVKFVYTPFKNLEHNYDNDPEFTEKLERLINFRDHFEVDFDANIQTWQHASGTSPHYIAYFEKHIQESINSPHLKFIKDIFKENKCKETYFSKDSFNIAVHIRRLNSHDNGVVRIHVPDSVYLKAINVLREEYRDKSPLFHIYSQGDFAYFNEMYGADDVIIHLNDPVTDVITPMVFADVLVTSPSSLSYVAGILSDGQIYYYPFWHPPLPGWRNIPE